VQGESSTADGQPLSHFRTPYNQDTAKFAKESRKKRKGKLLRVLPGHGRAIKNGAYKRRRTKRINLAAVDTAGKMDKN
jgi:hypothetical protein